MEKEIGASMIFVNRHSQVLLLLRDDKPEIPFPNRWDVLGGHVEEDETPAECIVREMVEEIGFTIQSPKLFQIFHQTGKIEYTFWQREDFDIDRITLNEGQRLQWFRREEIEAMPADAIAYEFKPILLEFFDFLFSQESPITTG